MQLGSLSWGTTLPVTPFSAFTAAASLRKANGLSKANYNFWLLKRFSKNYSGLIYIKGFSFSQNDDFLTFLNRRRRRRRPRRRRRMFGRHESFQSIMTAIHLLVGPPRGRWRRAGKWVRWGLTFTLKPPTAFKAWARASVSILRSSFWKL